MLDQFSKRIRKHRYIFHMCTNFLLYCLENTLETSNQSYAQIIIIILITGILTFASGPRVIGGQLAAPGQFPFQVKYTGRPKNNGTTRKNIFFQVSVQIKLNHLHFCAGSIIGSKHVLSAAHCYEFFDEDEIEVWVGGTNLNSQNDGVRMKVEKIIRHDYDEDVGKDNDIAILQVRKQQHITSCTFLNHEKFYLFNF